MAGAGDTVRGCREQTKTSLTVAIYLGTCNMPFGLLAAWAGWDYLSRVHTDIWKRAPGRLPSCLPFWPGQAPQFTLPYPRAVSQRCPGESEGRASAQKELRRNDLLCKRDLFQFPFSCEIRDASGEHLAGARHVGRCLLSSSDLFYTDPSSSSAFSEEALLPASCCCSGSFR